jgi:hypothetical protein
MSHTFSNVGSGTDSAQNSYFLPDYCEFGATESNSAKEGGQESSEHTTVNVFIGPAGTGVCCV